MAEFLTGSAEGLYYSCAAGLRGIPLTNPYSSPLYDYYIAFVEGV